MGEIVEMMEEGILCQACGVSMLPEGVEPDDWEPCGYFVSCKDCLKAEARS